MEIIRKIGDWAWANKERLVLAILVVFLVYRIYAVMNPTTLEEEAAAAARERAKHPTTATRMPGAPGGALSQPGTPGLGPGLGEEEGETDEEGEAEGAVEGEDAVEGEGEDLEGGGTGPQGRLRTLRESGAQTAQRTMDPSDAPFEFKQHMPPKRIADPNSLPEEWTADKGRPPMPQANPLPPAPVAFNALVKDNPFSASSTSGTGPTTGQERPNLTLLDIKEWKSGTYRAYILTRTRKWYAEGEQFETYQLMSIDPEAGTVEIFSEQHGRSFTYSLAR